MYLIWQLILKLNKNRPYSKNYLLLHYLSNFLSAKFTAYCYLSSRPYCYSHLSKKFCYCTNAWSSIYLKFGIASELYFLRGKMILPSNVNMIFKNWFKAIRKKQVVYISGNDNFLILFYSHLASIKCNKMPFCNLYYNFWPLKYSFNELAILITLKMSPLSST